MEEILKAFNDKEKYYSQAEAFLQENELAAEIDRDKFGADRENVNISLKAINVLKHKSLVRKLRKLTNIKAEPHSEEKNPVVVYFVLKLPREA